MTSDRTTHLACPTCGDGLARGPGAYSCPRGHSFDVARSGYVNLLPGRKRLSPTVGDSRAMLAARQRFLATGSFAPLTEALDALLAPAVRSDAETPSVVAEVGSGTGHHIAHLAERGINGSAYYGFDISKEAVKLAAREHRDVTFAVADVKRMVPLVDRSAHLVLDIFSPRNPVEFARVLAPDGLLVVVLPAPDHLGTLIERFELLTIPADKAQDVAGEMSSRLELRDSREISFEMNLSARQALDLIAMGPSARHVDLDRIADELRDDLVVTASMVILSFRPRHLG